MLPRKLCYKFTKLGYGLNKAVAVNSLIACHNCFKWKKRGVPVALAITKTIQLRGSQNNFKYSSFWVNTPFLIFAFSILSSITEKP